MLEKKTSKNQITLPKAGERLKAVKAKIKALGLSEKAVDDAIAWSRRRRR